LDHESSLRKEAGRLTVVKHDLLQIGQSALAGCSCFRRSSFNIIVIFTIESAIVGELVEAIEAREFWEDVEVDIFRRRLNML
jgi:hypothetical protein